MTTASTLVSQAHREMNVLGLNESLTTEQAAEGLALLNGFLDSLFGFELGEFSFDWPTPPSTTSPVLARFPLAPRSLDLPSTVWPYPPGNVRILMTLIVDTTIYLPQAPDDGARIRLIDLGSAAFNLTIQGNGRLVKSNSSITELATALDGQTLFYRADLGDWQLIPALLAGTDSPLPAAYDRLLVLGTVISLAPRYGYAMKPEQTAAFGRLLKRMKAQYRQIVLAPSAKPQPFLLPSADRERGFFSSTGRNLFQ